MFYLEEKKINLKNILVVELKYYICNLTDTSEALR